MVTMTTELFLLYEYSTINVINAVNRNISKQQTEWSREERQDGVVVMYQNMDHQISINPLVAYFDFCGLSLVLMY